MGIFAIYCMELVEHGLAFHEVAFGRSLFDSTSC